MPFISGFFNIRTRQWDYELLDQIDPSGGLRKAVPELLEAHQAVGKVRTEVAQRLGISSEAVVSSGGGDNIMGAIGTGMLTVL